MADKKISELTTASEIKNGDNLELSQDTGSGLVSLKATILAIANKILKGINFTSDLQTTDKTVIGAINEVAQGGGGGSSTLNGLNDVDIDDTTLADGQALVYDGIEEKWVNGQGGGGTGGHTIIDENGTSMTARAGLQFVGANVDDDSTNNKTIVDLASAGGIDGVFIDADNVIETLVGNGDMKTYTATEDCIVAGTLVGTSGNSPALLIDGVTVTYIDTNNVIGAFLYLKKGQVLSYRMASSGTNLKVYGIQTGTTHSKFQPVIYSLEEREIGVWTDGKPLYEKTIIDTLPSSATSKDISLNISNIDKIVSLKGIAIRSDGGTTQIEHARADDTIWSMINGAKTVLAINIKDNSYINQPVHFTLQYTKTTDTAGSGVWTPSGIPAVHYSEQEHIVGTWIDGKTLYEKTIDFGALPNNTTKTVAYNINNLGNIIEVKGIAYNQNGARPLPFVDDAYKSGDVLLDTIKSNGMVRIIANTDLSSLQGYVTLRYTKSA